MILSLHYISGSADLHSLGKWE